MRFLSLFSGIGAPEVAWIPLGWECVAVAEIEPFPCAVLAHHFPNVPNLGDITKITEEQIKALGHIDVVVGGFPCQDVSNAGLRTGLKHANGTLTRSGLFFTACRIAQWSGARWTVVENVPGLFSSNGGRDFASVVGELAGTELGVPPNGWRNAGVAFGPRGLCEWAVLDAKYRGVAQRRERVFLVRDSGDWSGRPPVLLEPESLRGNPEPRREKGEGFAAPLAAGSGSSGGYRNDADTTDNLVIPISDQATRHAGTDGRDGAREIRDVGKGHGLGVGRPDDPMFTLTKGDKHAVAHTLKAPSKGSVWRGDGSDNLVPEQAGCLDTEFGGSKLTHQSAVNGHFIPSIVPELAGCLQERDSKGPDSDTKPGHLIPCVAFDERQVTCPDHRYTERPDGPVPPLNTGGKMMVAGPAALAFKPSHFTRGKDGAPSETTPPLSDDADKGDQDTVVAVAFANRTRDGLRQAEATPDELAPALLNPGKGGRSDAVNVAWRMTVRRLTPVKCCRLQGFPDDWLDIKFRGKPAKDSPKYKAVGNSMATPIMRYLGEQIQWAHHFQP